MSVENSFKIHTTSPLLYSEPPFIVTTTGVVAGTVPRADWFLAIPGSTPALVYSRFNFDYDFEYYPGVDTASLHKLLLEDALAELRKRVSVELEQQTVIFNDVRLQEEDVTIFMRYRMRGVFNDAIEMLHTNLRNTVLRAQLQEFRAKELPEIVSSDT